MAGGIPGRTIRSTSGGFRSSPSCRMRSLRELWSYRSCSAASDRRAMCGICGIYRWDGAPVEAARVVRMRDAMVPRGPDAAGISTGPGFALGHRRLSIIDLSDAGRQPMENEDGTVLIVFNGEIYNHSDLRPELQERGHHFRSR